MRAERSLKPQATAFDALAMALAPALIIGMIASLVFFLVIAFYQGAYDARLMMILGFFTVGTVLIARIAIESGRTHANAFSVPLAIVAVIAMLRFVTVSGALAPLSWLINIGLLALAWYLADRITFDCTLVEDDKQGVPNGLLQSLGVAERARVEIQPPVAAATAPIKRARHNPGVWVLYFALLAFPLFGLGQLAITDPSPRQLAFWLLVSYLGCALSLLMTTSLLAMRRYLRQRGVSMPAEITLRWLATGGGLTVLVLLACMLLPLPGRSLGLVGLPFEIRSPEELPTSRLAVGNDGDQTEPDASTTAPAADEAAPAADAARGQAAAHQEQPAGQGRPREGQSEPQGQEQPSGQQQESEQASRPQPAEPRQDQPPAQASTARAKSPRSGSEREPPAGQQPRQQPQKEQQQEQQQEQEQEREQEKGQGQQDQRKQGQQEQGQQEQGQKQPGTESADRSQKTATSDLASSVAGSFQQFVGFLGRWLKWLTIAVLAAIVLFYAVTHPGELAKLWRDLLALLASLLGRRAASSAAAPQSAASTGSQMRPVRPFSSFENPFARNLHQWQATQVIEHTFAALEAWGAEQGRARQSDQTAEEYARALSAQMPQLNKLPVVAAGMLDREMFANWHPTLNEVAPLAELWRVLQTHGWPQK